MFMGTATIADDQGRNVPLLSPPRGGRRDPSRRAALQRISRVSGLQDLITRYGVMFWVTTIVVVMLSSYFAPGFFPRIPFLVVLIVVGVVASSVIERASVASIAPRIVDAAMREGRCPGCGCGLGAPGADARIATCPDCGAGWRADRIGIQTLVAPLPPGRTFGIVNEMAANDDRGRRVPIRRPGLWYPLDETDPDLVSRIHRVRAASSGVSKILVRLTAIIALLVGAGIFAAPPSTLGTSLLVGALVAMFILIVAIIAAQLRYIGTPPDELAVLLKRFHLCPCCNSDLADRAPDADGATTCGVCAAAWTIPPGPPCPRCGYPLTQAAANPTDRRTCPECGTTEQLRRSTSRVPPPRTSTTPAHPSSAADSPSPP